MFLILIKFTYHNGIRTFFQVYEKWFNFNAAFVIFFSISFSGESPDYNIWNSFCFMLIFLLFTLFHQWSILWFHFFSLIPYRCYFCVSLLPVPIQVLSWWLIYLKLVLNISANISALCSDVYHRCLMWRSCSFTLLFSLLPSRYYDGLLFPSCQCTSAIFVIKGPYHLLYFHIKLI